MTVMIPDVMIDLAIIIFVFVVFLGGAFLLAKIPHEWPFLLAAVIFFSMANALYREISPAIEVLTWLRSSNSGFIYPILLAGMLFEQNRSRRFRR